MTLRRRQVESSSSRWVEDAQVGEAAAVEAAVAAEENIGLPERMGADQEVGDDPRSVGRGPAAAAVELAPETPRERGRLRCDRVETEPEQLGRFLEDALLREVRPDLGPDHVAGDQRPGAIGGAQRLPRPLAEVRIRAEDVEEDRGVDGRPRKGKRDWAERHVYELRSLRKH